MQKISEILGDIIHGHEGEHITLQSLINRLEGRAFSVGIILFALPNAIPLGIPGISSICAIPILFFAVQMIMGRKNVWLPHWLGKRTLSMAVLTKSVKMTRKPLVWLERFIRPRIVHLTGKMAEKCTGLLIVVLAAIIFLPIPFGNTPPSIGMIIVSMGLLAKDGVLVLGGWVLSVLVIGAMAFAIGEAAAWVVGLI